MRPWLRTSAWLPPGLALGWLAVLGTFVHSVGNLLTAWAATVSLVVLLARWRPTTRPGGPSENAGGSAKPQDPGSPTSGSTPSSAQASGGEEGVGDSATHSTSTATSISRSYDPPSGSSSEAEPVWSDGPSRTEPDTSASLMAGQTGTSDIAVTLGMRVLTAAEVASVLRVQGNEIIMAISNGELPGNRIGGHWRVDCDALARWLQGAYGDLADRGSPSSATAPRTGRN